MAHLTAEQLEGAEQVGDGGHFFALQVGLVHLDDVPENDAFDANKIESRCFDYFAHESPDFESNQQYLFWSFYGKKNKFIIYYVIKYSLFPFILSHLPSC
jgi:hypothetical protein